MTSLSTGQRIALGTLLAVGILIVAFFAFNEYIYTQKQAGPDPVAYQATLTGEYVCLPHTDTSGPQTLECALGLKTDAGEYYALDFNLMPTAMAELATGDRISANGTITPVALLSSDHWQQYPIEGIFSVTDSLEIIR